MILISLAILVVFAAALLIIAGIRTVVPGVMAWCFTFGLAMIVTQADWRVPVGVGLVGAGTTYIFLTIALQKQVGR